MPPKSKRHKPGQRAALEGTAFLLASLRASSAPAEPDDDEDEDGDQTAESPPAEVVVEKEVVIEKPKLDPSTLDFGSSPMEDGLDAETKWMFAQRECDEAVAKDKDLPESASLAATLALPPTTSSAHQPIIDESASLHPSQSAPSFPTNDNQPSSTTAKETTSSAETKKILIEYDFSAPKIVFEMPNKEPEGRPLKNNFYKGCKWSTDGQYLVTCDDNRVLCSYTLQKESSVPSLEPISTNREGDLIYDYCWLPSADQPYHLASTSRANPIHMRDVRTGANVITYRTVNHLDELSAAVSIKFSPDAGHLWAGYNKMIRLFDVRRGSRQIRDMKTSEKQAYVKQSGMISCLAVTDSNPDVLVAGSYSRSIAVYSQSLGQAQCSWKAHAGGITSLAFVPERPQYLVSAARRDNELFVWDMRMIGKTVASFQRPLTTNQRIYFDMDTSGQWLLSGDSQGVVHVYSLTELVQKADAEPFNCTYSWQAHGSAVNGCALHPQLPIVATTSGQRIFRSHWMEDSSGSESDPESSAVNAETSESVGYDSHEVYERSSAVPIDNSLKLWSITKSNLVVEEQESDGQKDETDTTEADN